MKKRTKRNIALGVIYLILLGVTLALIFSFEPKSTEPARKVGFITEGEIFEKGWTAINYRGIKSACEEYGAELITVSDVYKTYGSCQKAVENLKKSGAKLIILNNVSLAEEMREHFSEYPEIAFYGAGADFSAENFTPYSSRMYQIRYLSGIIAGLYTKTNKIGFVSVRGDLAAIRGINAFALGARKVNPNAEIIVGFTNSWENEAEEVRVTEALINNENADIITYHQHQPFAVYAADKLGAASIGYYDIVTDASDRFLTSAVCDWQPVYEEILKEYLRGQANDVRSDWLGIESGIMRLSDYSPLVTEEMSAAVENAKAELRAGGFIFSGEIYDANGQKRCAAGEVISDETLLHKMDWFIKGVRVYEEKNVV